MYYDNNRTWEKTAKFRFYEELNDFLPKKYSKVTFVYHFSGNPAIKDCIEAMGVPHTEVDLILINGQSVDFGYKLRNGDRAAVYPSFESIDISNVTRLRPKPLRTIKFIVDIHLGKLAKYLRILGFDTAYKNNYSDKEIIAIAQQEKRIILTRDIGLLKDSGVTRGYWVRHITAKAQVKEIISRFDLVNKIKPFSRCLACNGKLSKIAKEEIINLLPADTKRYYHEFYQCSKCAKVYWPGSHYKDMMKNIKRLGY